MPRNIAELCQTSKCYEEVGLPSCCGSMDVVHIKWSSCPTGDHNHAKGKAGYPTLAFQCITDFNRRVIGIYGPQFGTCNDKEIVKVDPNVHHICTGWFKDILWNYCTTTRARCVSYLGQRLSLLANFDFPYADADCTSLEGYFFGKHPEGRGVHFWNSEEMLEDF